MDKNKRLIQVAKENNVSVHKLLLYCEQLGLTHFSSSSRIDVDTEEQLLAFLVQSSFKKKKIELTPLKPTSPSALPEWFLKENPFEGEQVKLIETADVFSARVERILSTVYGELPTIFTDFEACSICLGLDDLNGKKLARNFLNGLKSPPEELFEAHRLAMEAREKYGNQLLAYVMSLPPLPFKALDAKQIFSVLDKRKKVRHHPIIRLVFKNAHGRNEILQITYYAEQTPNGRKRLDNVLMVKNKTTNTRLFGVSRQGEVVPFKKAKNIVPALQLFIRNAQDTNGALIHYGLETGECAICGRELTDAESIKRGIGPICQKYLS